MADEMRPLAVVTGASTGIGFELAKPRLVAAGTVIEWDVRRRSEESSIS
jgi:NAD(P)-dependent dehydrogenase (short-subunit alcohol dehydrogenase family)